MTEYTTEILRSDYPVMDMSWKYYARHGDHRSEEHAICVLTTTDGKVLTHFARPYSRQELAAIAEYERIHDC